MTFQALDGKGQHFLNLLDDKLNDIEPSYVKEGPWLQSFGHSNGLYACASRAITNYTLIGKYRLRFFPREEFKCPCGLYPIESWRHICQDCWRWTSFLFSSFILFILFYFIFIFILFSIFRTTWVRVYQSSCHISHKTDHGTWENEVKGSGIRWRHTTWITHVSLMLYTWSFRVGCTVVSTDHE